MVASGSRVGLRRYCPLLGWHDAHRRRRVAAILVVRGLAEYTLGHVTGCRGLILDLRGLDFFGAKGFSALHKISAGCARAGIGWALVPGAAISRVLRICDPQGTLPAASTLGAALAEHRRKTGRT
jgi:anti-anti-sigma regulatory factor